MKEEQLNIFDIDSSNDNSDKEKIEELRKKIEYHNKKYYEDDNPEITDFEYDKLTQSLKKLEAKHPEYVNSNSPTQKIGGRTKNIFTKVEHDVQMQSLQDVFELDDVREFVKKIQLEYGKDTEFVVETKIDGLSVSLEYVDGNLVRGSTRGDGFVGEDVTENLKEVEGIPKKLNKKETLEVRGEVYLPRENFEKINEKLEKLGKQVLANPRNAAAGTLRQLDTKLVKDRCLSIFVFNLQKGKNFKTHTESIEYINSLGIKTIEYITKCATEEDVIEAINKIGKIRDNLPYDIDGAVVKVNEISKRNSLGTTVKVPKWAVAYKYPPEQKETKIIDVKVQVGRTGIVTPMAILEPVRIAGSKISKTTLHNFDYINQKDIRIGDTVIVQKAGDVIPEVIAVNKEKRNGTQKQVNIPTVCPVCKEKLEKFEDEVALRCTNSECEAQIYRSIIHFASRDAMDISGLGETIVEKLIDKNLIKDVADIYYLKYEDVVSIDRFGKKSAENLINAIEKTKKNTLDKLIFGFGIRHIGKKAAKILAKNYKDIYEIMTTSKEELQALEDFGEIMAESIVEFFKKQKTKDLILKLDKVGVNLKGSIDTKSSDKLSRKSIWNNRFI